MGGETFLFAVYGFLEPNRWVSLEEQNLPICLYTNDFGHTVVYGIHGSRIAKGKAASIAYLEECAKAAEQDRTFTLREKPLMDCFAQARGTKAEWIIAVGGDFYIHARGEESDGYASDGYESAASASSENAGEDGEEEKEDDNENEDDEEEEEGDNENEDDEEEEQEDPADLHYRNAMAQRKARAELLVKLQTMWNAKEHTSSSSSSAAASSSSSSSHGQSN